MDLSNNKLKSSIMKLNKIPTITIIAKLPININIALTLTAAIGSTLCRSAGALVLIFIISSLAMMLQVRIL